MELNNYYIFLFSKKNYFAVPRSSISDIDLKTIHSQINKNQNNNSNKLKIPDWTYFLNFIPNIGLLSGIVFLILGISNKNRKTIKWGIFGILFTPLFWFAIMSVFEKTVKLNSGFSDFAQMRLNDFVKELTYYKVKNGVYPDNLNQLEKQMNFFDENDPSTIDVLPWKKTSPQKFYYKKTSDSTYILKSVGRDRILNTKDDIYPTLK